jgi:hypothetical protein
MREKERRGWFMGDPEAERQKEAMTIIERLF